VERTHQDAKTIAQAAKFVQEAFRCQAALREQPLFQETFSRFGNKIAAGVNVFSGKRLIDAGKPRQALGYFRQAGQASPGVLLKSWYKVVQALGGALGLTGLFLGYRQARRSVQHQRRRLVVNDRGVTWEE
jgi:hypothetical protein